MPELPEVTTTVNGLATVLRGKTITDIWNSAWSGAYIARNTHKNKSYFASLRSTIVGAKILSVTRRAKYIIINLSNTHSLIIHMKMTGHLLYGEYVNQHKRDGSPWGWEPKATTGPLRDPFNRHIKTVFTLSQGKKVSHLVFCDHRKFGTIAVVPTKEVMTTHLAHLGKEPLEDSFTLGEFTSAISNSSRAIKTILMDQTRIAGIGNIYSDEMLHLAHILPVRPASTLTTKEIRALYIAMKKVLTLGIHFGGDSTSDYRNIDGNKGNFHGKHLVYLRKGERCLRKGCRGVISKKTINGRSAHFCTTCQN